jgi:hypothetical protein
VTIASYKPTLFTVAGVGTEPAAGLSPAVADASDGQVTFALRNPGNEALRLGTARLVGAGFAVVSDACSRATVAPSATCTVGVRFAADELGWRSARLELPVTNLVGSPVVARVTARGPSLGGTDNDTFASPALGDVNGDGADDLAVGADSTAATNSDAAYVVFGAKNDPAGAQLDTAALGTRGYRILGAPGSSAGYGVASAGDVNRDGVGDVLVGGYGSGSFGRSWVVFGVKNVASLPANNDGGVSAVVPANLNDSTRYVSLATLGADQGSSLSGVTAGERFGRQVVNIGDVDGNGAADLAVGADMAFRYGRTRAGEVTVALVPGPVPAPPVATPTPTATATPTATPEPTATATPVPFASPAPTATPAPAPAAKPVPTLTTRALTADAAGRVALGIRCHGIAVACPGNVALTLAGTRRTATFTAQPGKPVALRVTLTAAQRRSLTRHGRLQARLTLAVTVGGTTTTRALIVTVRGAQR